MVLDNTILVHALIVGPRTDLAREVLIRDPDWAMPVLWRSEFLNVLATYARLGGLPEKECQRLWALAVNLFEPAERPVDLAAALALAIRHSLSAYDAQYVELARTLGTRLVTEDRELLRKLPDLAWSMEAFCNGPGR